MIFPGHWNPIDRLRICRTVYTNAVSAGTRQRTGAIAEKHGIGFDTAVRVFFDPLHLSRLDRIIAGEERWQTIGRVDGVLLVLVAYTVLDEDEEVFRIISARKVTRQERIEYEEANEI
jgi:uncharacterized DUF497 family protein